VTGRNERGMDGYLFGYESFTIIIFIIVMVVGKS